MAYQKYGRRYPWKKWLCLDFFRVEKGKDFNGRAASFITLVRHTIAQSHVKEEYGIEGARVQLSSCENFVTVTLVKNGKTRQDLPRLVEVEEELAHRKAEAKAAYAFHRLKKKLTKKTTTSPKQK